jgi:hypothetical protein
MADFADTTAYPAYASKQALLRDLMLEAQNCPNLVDFLFQLNNTDLNALADKSTIYNPADSFNASV